jgi:hypothetical protein
MSWRRFHVTLPSKVGATGFAASFMEYVLDAWQEFAGSPFGFVLDASEH